MIKKSIGQKEGFYMIFAFEVIMGIVLDLAMLIMVFNLAYKRAHGSSVERITALCMGLGFLIYCISKIVIGSGYAMFTIASLGFMLSYTAFIFTFSWE